MLKAKSSQIKDFRISFTGQACVHIQGIWRFFVALNVTHGSNRNRDTAKNKDAKLNTVQSGERELPNVQKFFPGECNQRGELKTERINKKRQSTRDPNTKAAIRCTISV